MKLTRTANPVEETAAELGRLFEVNREKPVLFFSSGGSALRLLERDLPIPLNLTLTVLDERWSTDPTISNFLQLQKTKFFKKAVASGAQTISPVPLVGETLSHTGKRFERELEKWRLAYPSGVSIATMGMGEDGHTAGIFPMPNDSKRFAELFEGKNQVVAYEAQTAHPFRITVTLPFIRTIDVAILLAAGASKRAALKETLEQGPLPQIPARIVHQMKNIQIFTDLDVEN